MSRRLRFRFSLATLLVVVMWSSVVVWMNVTPRVDRLDIVVVIRQYGWPWNCMVAFHTDGVHGERYVGLYCSYWRSIGDAAVGVVLVAVLTWGSNQLLRRVGTKLRRRSAAKEQV